MGHEEDAAAATAMRMVKSNMKVRIILLKEDFFYVYSSLSIITWKIIFLTIYNILII